MTPRSFRACSRDEARAIDARAVSEFGIPSICLMENAGSGAARIALESRWNLASGVVCVCGPGQNGGDGLVVARHLAIEGVRVEVVRVAKSADAPARGDAGTQWAICRALRLPLLAVPDLASVPALAERLGRCSLVVDALFGTGLDRPVAGVGAAVIGAIGRSGRDVLALDLPSGLDCDTGIPLGPCVRATVTATFAAPKKGFANPESRRFTGDVRVVGIGAPPEWPPG